MKKIVSLLLTAFLVLGLCGCATREKDEDHISIVATTFPIYDWIMNLIKDNPAQMEVRMLLDNGVDLHSYQPTAKDVMDIENCDMFVFVGGESDEWTEDILDQMKDHQLVIISLMEKLDSRLKIEEAKEGMETEEEEEEEYDEHIWLSLVNAKACVEEICDGLMKLDEENSDYYRQNKESYLLQLDDLDRAYRETTAGSSYHTLVFGDRFPFRYLFDDYGIDYYAAFKGCSAESEASFDTIVFLAGKVDELGLKSIMIIDGSDGKIAETIAENTKNKDQKIVRIDSMQSSTMQDYLEGKNYLSIMQDNLDVLKEVME